LITFFFGFKEKLSYILRKPSSADYLLFLNQTKGINKNDFHSSLARISVNDFTTNTTTMQKNTTARAAFKASFLASPSP
jgi:hypothetical protein